MSFTGNENQSISLADASVMTRSYRTANPGQIIGGYFGQSSINAILAQANCVGIRIYYALDSAGTKQLVICGVTANQDDLYLGVLADRCFNCPPSCGASNPLNT